MCSILILATETALAGVVNEEYLERKGAICEPNLLQRRAAEHIGAKQRFFNALVSNSVWLQMQDRRICSGTFITPNCVLTAAHCINSKKARRNIVARNHLAIARGGLGFIDEHYVRKVGEKLRRGWVSGDDIGIVRFKTAFKSFRPVGLSYALGNLNTWFFEANKPDLSYGSSLRRFDLGHWQNFGTLGLTGFTRQSNRKPLKLCSDSAFLWAPCFSFDEERHQTPILETGVMCHVGEQGPGMSGGSFYDEQRIFGILVEGPRPPDRSDANFIKIKNHWWYRHPRSFFSSNVMFGFANRSKVILREDRKFILKHCPKADIELRTSRKGLRVRDPSLANKRGTKEFWLPGGKDVWRKLRLNDRNRRVNRKIRPGDSGEFVSRLQERLRELRLYNGKIDGTYRVGTTKAVRRFQAGKDIKQTGTADKETLVEMGIWFNKLN